MLLICLFLASEARRVLLTVWYGIGYDDAHGKTFIKVFTVPYKTHLHDVLAANHPRLIAKNWATMYIYVITRLVRGRKLATDDIRFNLTAVKCCNLYRGYDG